MVGRRSVCRIWFDDNLEIVSYGGIPKNLTKEEFLSGKTEPVNKELMKIFLQCGIVEQSGHGVPIVVRKYGDKAYEFSENMINVIIPFAKAQNETVNATVKLNETKKEILAQNKANSNITLNELVNILHKHRATIARNTKA